MFRIFRGHSFISRAVRVFAVLAASVAGVFAFTSPASAASDPVAVCGSGYYVQTSHDLGWQNNNTSTARVYLLYNASTGYNCAVTVHINGMEGFTWFTSAGIRADGGSWITDGKDYKYYAGPVRVKAPGKCVQFSGQMEWLSGSGHPQIDSYTSPLGWCG